MDKHRVIIGWLFASVAMFITVFVVFTWKRAFGVDAVPHTQEVVKNAVAVAVLFSAVASALLLKYRYSAWLCLPVSVTLLFYFPMGTILGAYYLWYFWRYVYKAKSS
jgi:hypothetical protein